MKKFYSEFKSRQYDKCYDLFLLLNKKTYEQHLKALRKKYGKISRLVFTIDYQPITDYFGLRAGDEAIFAVSLALFQCFGGAYRIKYNEFVILNPGADYEKHLEKFNKIISNWHGVFAPYTKASVVYAEGDSQV
nr:hypothetical protein [uncultured Treponema sp.]